MNEFLQRLKQRKIVQWSIAYVAAAFALLQGMDIVAQRFGWPEQTMRLVIIALTIGLFVTLVLAWYHGECGAQRVTGTELIILALLLGVGGGFLWRFARGSREEPAAAGSNSAASIPEKSIAVLPFVDMSEKKDQGYFSDGLSEELLDLLTQVPDCASRPELRRSPSGTSRMTHRPLPRSYASLMSSKEASARWTARSG